MLTWRGDNSGWDNGHGAGNACCWSPALSKFVAVGGFSSGSPLSAVCHTSSDGINWQKRSTASAPALSAWYDVAWSPALSLFVAVGNDRDFCCGGPPWTNTIWTSPDGITWTPRGAPVSNSTALGAVVWSPALGIFVASGNTSLTSPDGITWTQRVTGGGSACCWSPDLGLFVEVGGGIRTSPDGVTWTTQTGHNFAATYPRQVCWSPHYGLFYAAGSGADGNPVETSPDGVTWTPLVDAVLAGLDLSGGIIEAFDTMIIVGSHLGAYKYESRDGATFARQIVQIDAGPSFCYSPEFSLVVNVGFGSLLHPVESIYVTQPFAVTGSATSSCSTATLNATITPNTAVGHDVTYRFRWGLSPVSHPNVTPDETLAGGLDPEVVSATITGLSPGSTVYYRIECIHEVTFVVDQYESVAIDCPDSPVMNAEFDL